MIASTVLLQLKIYLDLSRGMSLLRSSVRDGGGGELSHFSEGLYSRNLGQIGVFGGNRLLGGVIFFRWGLKIPCIYKK